MIAKNNATVRWQQTDDCEEGEKENRIDVSTARISEPKWRPLQMRIETIRPWESNFFSILYS